MWQLVLGVVLFVGPHLWSILLPAQRDAVKTRWGEARFKFTYLAVSLVGILLFAWAYQLGRSGPATLDMLYEPLVGARHFAMLLILAGFILIFANGSQSHIRRLFKHPFSMGIVLWSLAHLLVNGETAVVVIFASFLLVAALDVIMSFASAKMPVFEPKWSHDVRSVVVGLVLYAAFLLGFHPYILNVPVI